MSTSKHAEPRIKRALVQYWEEASRPLVSLVFVAPMLVAYEGGLMLLGPQAMRNGADVWLRQLLQWMGFRYDYLLPLLTCVILLAWHHVQRQRWRLRGLVLYGMAIESMAFGSLLLVVAQLQGSWLNSVAGGAWECSIRSVGQVIAFLGAGIYEELLFRLMLLPLLAALFRLAGLPRGASLVTAVVASSLLFAAAHYRIELSLGHYFFATSLGDSFTWSSFLFRLTAGFFFSALFVYRGFGIAAGAHALYDILVTLA